MCVGTILRPANRPAAYRWATAPRRSSARPRTPTDPAQSQRHWLRIAGNWICTRKSVERSAWRPARCRCVCCAPRGARSRCAGTWTTVWASSGAYRNRADFAVICGNRSSCSCWAVPESARSARANRNECPRTASASDCQIQCPSSSGTRNPGTNTVGPCSAARPRYRWWSTQSGAVVVCDSPGNVPAAIARRSADWRGSIARNTRRILHAAEVAEAACRVVQGVSSLCSTCRCPRENVRRVCGFSHNCSNRVYILFWPQFITFSN